jgi:DNA-binding transcriptional regulator GbsR (MarR family)
MNNKKDQTQLNELIDLAGEIAELFSFNRSIGQIYAFLYFCQDPVALEDIATNCKMSKGNASLLLRTLLDWEAVRLSSKTGTRKDYYVANKNLQALAFKQRLGGSIDGIELGFFQIRESSTQDFLSLKVKHRHDGHHDESGNSKNKTT